MTDDKGATGAKTTAAIEAETAATSDQRRVQPKAKLGVKTAADVAAQTAPTGPLFRYGSRPPVREGAKVGVKGEAEGLVDVSETNRAETKAKILEAQGSGPFAPGGRAPASREGDYLADERSGPTAPAGDPSPPEADPAAGAGGTLPATDPAAAKSTGSSDGARAKLLNTKRAKLDKMAAAAGVTDADKLPNKEAVADAILAAEGSSGDTAEGANAG